MPQIITEYPQFFTATNLEWKKLLKPEKYKDIVINSLKFLVENKRVRVFCFIIMDNHIHLIWQMLPGNKPENVQRDFLKYTAQRIRNALSIELRQRKVFIQKVGYIHANAIRAGICKFPEEYKYSSALFYESGIDNFGFLTHYNE